MNTIVLLIPVAVTAGLVSLASHFVTAHEIGLLGASHPLLEFVMHVSAFWFLGIIIARYLVLGLRLDHMVAIIFTACLSLAFGVFDEFSQMRVIGRGAQFTDLLLDFIGGAMGGYSYVLWRTSRDRGKQVRMPSRSPYVSVLFDTMAWALCLFVALGALLKMDYFESGSVPSAAVGSAKQERQVIARADASGTTDPMPGGPSASSLAKLTIKMRESFGNEEPTATSDARTSAVAEADSQVLSTSQEGRDAPPKPTIGTGKVATEPSKRTARSNHPGSAMREAPKDNVSDPEDAQTAQPDPGNVLPAETVPPVTRAYATSQSTGPRELPHVVIIIHPSNPIEELTLTQARMLFSGLTRNWRQLGGDNMAVQIVTSGTRVQDAGDQVAKRLNVSPAYNALVFPFTTSVIPYVAQTREAAGFVPIKTISQEVFLGLQKSFKVVRLKRDPPPEKGSSLLLTHLGSSTLWDNVTAATY